MINEDSSGKYACELKANRGMELIPEDAERLTLVRQPAEYKPENIIDALRSDQVVLVQNVDPQDADDIIADVASRFDLFDSLELQAGYAAVQGHRERVGKYFMSVNQRDGYHFIPSHSEGMRSGGFQLASFYCYENSTDGGVTILQNIDEESSAWPQLREVMRKVDLSARKLSAAEAARLKAVHLIGLPDGALCEEDEILQELPSPLPGVPCFTVLARLKRIHSAILGRPMYAYWDSVASTDSDASKEYLMLLRRLGLLREPVGGADLRGLDNTHPRKKYSSGVKYSMLFKAMITRKLAPGELLIQNNMTWTHAASNWTPGSGNRKITAAFA